MTPRRQAAALAGVVVAALGAGFLGGALLARGAGPGELLGTTVLMACYGVTGGVGVAAYLGVLRVASRWARAER